MTEEQKRAYIIADNKLAENAGWKCLAVELNPVYVDVAVRRWENFSGKKAVLLTANGA